MLIEHYKSPYYAVGMTRERRALTAEERAEAAALHRLFSQRWEGTQVGFGDTYGIGTQGAVSQYLRGYVPLNLEAALKFAVGLEVDVADFSPRLAKLLPKPERALQVENLRQRRLFHLVNLLAPEQVEKVIDLAERLAGIKKGGL